MNKFIVAVIFFSFQVFASEREHKLKVITVGGVKTYSIADLNKLFPAHAEVTTSLQKEPQQKFEGIYLKDLVAKWSNGAASKIRMTATNKYTVFLEPVDWNERNALFAWKSDGKNIPTRDRGSFRVVYDYGKWAEDKETYVKLETNSIWQIVELELIP